MVRLDPKTRGENKKRHSLENGYDRGRLFGKLFGNTIRCFGILVYVKSNFNFARLFFCLLKYI